MKVASDPTRFIRFLILKYMTLRDFIKENNLNLDYKDRAKIGYRIRYLKANYTYKKEHEYYVRDYEEGFFDRHDVQSIILNYMTNG